MKNFEYKDFFYCLNNRDHDDVEMKLICDYAQVGCYGEDGVLIDQELTACNPVRIFLKCVCGQSEEITDDIIIWFEDGTAHFKMK